MGERKSTLTLGVPTDLDVRRLREAFGVPEIGTVITYDEVTAVLKIPRTTCRWRTVTGAWRRGLMAECRIIMGCKQGEGFIALDDPSKVDLGAHKLRSGLRAFRRTSKVIAHTDMNKLTTEERRRADHVQVVATSMLIGAREADLVLHRAARQRP